MKNSFSIASPLTKITLKGVKFVWYDKCIQAFQPLKTRLTLTPILIILKRGVGYAVYYDASLSSTGCVLMHKGRVFVYDSF